MGDELTLESGPLDLDSRLYPPLPQYDLRAPYSQTHRSLSADIPTEVAPGMAAEAVVPRRRLRQGRHANRFIVIGRWRGWVTAVLQDTFVAEVEDQRWGSPPHEVELPIDLVNDFDRTLLHKNSIFYWTVGYRHRPGGTRVQEAQIRFRRAPGPEPWTKRTGRAWAERVRRALDEDPEG